MEISTVIWCGKTFYRCAFCTWSNHQKHKVRQHMFRDHLDAVRAAQQEALTPAVPLYGPDGNLIEQMPGGVDLAGVEAAIESAE